MIIRIFFLLYQPGARRKMWHHPASYGTEFNTGTLLQSCEAEFRASAGRAKYPEASVSKKLFLLGLKEQKEGSMGRTQRRLVYRDLYLEWQMEDTSTAINSDVIKFHLRISYQPQKRSDT